MASQKQLRVPSGVSRCRLCTSFITIPGKLSLPFHLCMTFFKCEYLSRFNFQLYLAFHTALHMPALLRLKKCERYRMFCPLSQLIVQSHIRPARFLFRNTNVPKNLLQVFSHFLSSTVGKSFQPCSSFSKMESFK